MWTLVILMFWWMPQSTDAGSTVSVPGFTSKEYCLSAGEQYIKDAGKNVRLSTADGRSHIRSLYYHYQCVEVK